MIHHVDIEPHAQVLLPEAGEHLREVEHLESGAPELFRDRRTADAHLDQGLPEFWIVARVAVEDLAHPRERTLVLGQLSNRRLEQLLFFRDVEVHGYLLLWAAQSRGRPRPRSPITLRWMLELPAAIAPPSEPM